MKAVVFYLNSKASRDQIMAVYPKHKAYLDGFVEAGKILGIGPFIRAEGGSMGIFPTRADAESFISKDPFVLEGLAGEVSVVDWKDDLL